MRVKFKGKEKIIGALGLAGALGLLAFRNPADGNPVQVLAEKLSAYYITLRPEKAYLHLDRPAYGTGETIWFSAYVVDALRHQPDTLSKVLHVDLLSPQRLVVARRTLRLAGGRGYGDIELGDTLAAGTYLLRAYTDWMRNAGNGEYFFERQLQVWPAAPNQPDAPDAGPALAISRTAPKTPVGKPDVQFFAEGGNLVAGLPATVGFKAQAASGRSIAVSGQLFDEQNKSVGAAFSSQHGGMGRLSFTPAAGHHYHARVKLPDGSSTDFPLPAAQPTGYGLRVLDAGDSYTVEARYQGTPGAPVPGPVMLLTEVRGYIVGLVPRPITDDGAPVTWKLVKSRYPNGILHITLFDAQSTAQAQRLAFVLNGLPALRVTLTPDKAAYAPHDPVHVKVQVTDATGQPAAAHLSVTVAEAGAAALDPNGGNVATSLLLTSDLAGYVENPGYYFQTPTPEITLALDNLLLTQGWRRYVWKEVLSPTPPPLVYGAEQGITLAGQVTGAGHQGLANAQLTFIQSKPNRSVLTASTETNGRFRFTGFPGRDTAVITLQARRASGASNVVIRPDLGPPTFGAPLPPLPPLSAAPAGVADYLRRSRQQQVQERQNRPEGDIARNIKLGNVAVTGKKEVIPANDTRRLYPGVVANTLVDFTDIPAAQSGMSALQILQGRVAGLTISGSPPNMSIQIRNSGTPLFILDGQRTDAEFINTLQANQVEAVEVFKGPEAAIFGAGSSGGVIAIYTKRGNKNYKGDDSKTPTPGLITIRVPAYYRAQEFYQPRYGAPVMNAPTMDARRLTLFWDPQVSTGPNGQTEFLFYTADGSGNFQISTEGITLEGTPSRGSSTIYVAPKGR
ncbi:TonB-dependent receptor plug domain-containing protein [Hymenobacter psoromatis]|uniref:TonB-dependent receptor plug domain-containing protein n=1 Tax=Hymenobacter psoromatis TaxID=1484116 RepID=UPI001CC0B761|nr:TonB-dependent receptor plug domain-containing protein [Hymenobacter psoromatis]